MPSAIKFSQEAWLKSYIKMKTVQRKNLKKKLLRKRFSHVYEQCSFGKSYGKSEKTYGFKLVAKARKNYLLSEPD